MLLLHLLWRSVLLQHCSELEWLVYLKLPLHLQMRYLPVTASTIASISAADDIQRLFWVMLYEQRRALCVEPQLPISV